MSITKNNNMQCDTCGCLIGYLDLIVGAATHILVEPDRFESKCRRCIVRENEQPQR